MKSQEIKRINKKFLKNELMKQNTPQIQKF